MANFVSTKEMRDNFDSNFLEWQKKVDFFKEYLLNLNK